MEKKKTLTKDQLKKLPLSVLGTKYYSEIMFTDLDGCQFYVKIDMLNYRYFQLNKNELGYNEYMKGLMDTETDSFGTYKLFEDAQAGVQEALDAMNDTSLWYDKVMSANYYTVTELYRELECLYRESDINAMAAETFIHLGLEAVFETEIMD